MQTNTLPQKAGLGLRTPHLPEVLAQMPEVAWWEVHSENYFGGGAPMATLRHLRSHYPISLHGVGLGLGNQTISTRHLQQLVNLVDEIEPQSVSEHLAWNRYGAQVFPDLLPLPRLEGVLEKLVEHIDHVQNKLQRRILLENVSTSIQFKGEIYSEAELLAHLVQKTGCGILLDVNNLYVNQINLGVDPYSEIAKLPLAAVGEIHIAGFEMIDDVAIDTHGAPPCDAVWQLLADVLKVCGPLPVLLERDTHLPSWPELYTDYQSLVQFCQAQYGEQNRCPQ
ncbi:DUF692 domain-containing protein [Chitinibacter bivalviorum]|uniref:DUF692 domain-containing protein n=1 Tax=Chitinibacter bivalviorum TaxID=2739434 RepID=A0A7H9BGZ4_9NEIS|nr:DUF692 domain-containing protein [Chitinibacter bivalviorum]QLG87526.1 DUF692 domain-containing protein [Chitinibacter bivalviorum]